MRVLVDRDAGLQGRYAGIGTRSAAFLLDLAVISLSFALVGNSLDYLVSRIFGVDEGVMSSPVVANLLLVAWAFTYFAYQLSLGGRTLGMALLGLKVVRSEGRDLDARHAVLRVLVLPLSFLLLWFGILLIVLRRDRRALHDLIADTAVVYAWDARSARLRALAKGAPAKEP